MRNSYFERLFKRCMDKGWDWAYAKLSFQGRMHQDIMAFPNENFYNGQLAILPPAISANGRQTRPLDYQLPAEADELTRLIASRRLLFIPTGSDDLTGNLKTNREEAELIAQLVKAFFQLYQKNGKEIRKDTIGIITPYRAQIAQIQEVLNQQAIDLELLTIDTVERYQGGARNIILLSLCTNALHQLESLISLSEDGIDRKLNVALTRAREHIVIAGNPDLLTHDPTYRALIEKGRASL
jgi:DNA replication ATP-dependent helicase Dna2